MLSQTLTGVELLFGDFFFLRGFDSVCLCAAVSVSLSAPLLALPALLSCEYSRQTLFSFPTEGAHNMSGVNLFVCFDRMLLKSELTELTSRTAAPTVFVFAPRHAPVFSQPR